MENYTLSQKLALIGLNGLDAVNMPIAKKAVLRGIFVAQAMEKLIANKDSFENASNLSLVVPENNSAGKLTKKELLMLERDITDELKGLDVMDEVQDLMACDMYFETAGLSMRQYRSTPEIYLIIVEWIRAEVLEEGMLSLECICMLWLLRETSVLHDLFTLSEQETVNVRLMDCASKQANLAELLETELRQTKEMLGIDYLKKKAQAFHNPYLQGINLFFPFLERRQAIFIDFVVLGTNVAGRRQKVISYLQDRGHYIEEQKHGEETLLKIDNIYYRVFPSTRMSKFPIQGVSLVPFYE